MNGGLEWSGGDRQVRRPRAGGHARADPGARVEGGACCCSARYAGRDWFWPLDRVFWSQTTSDEMLCVVAQVILFDFPQVDPLVAYCMGTWWVSKKCPRADQRSVDPLDMGKWAAGAKVGWAGAPPGGVGGDGGGRCHVHSGCCGGGSGLPVARARAGWAAGWAPPTVYRLPLVWRTVGARSGARARAGGPGRVSRRADKRSVSVRCGLVADARVRYSKLNASVAVFEEVGWGAWAGSRAVRPSWAGAMASCETRWLRVTTRRAGLVGGGAGCDGDESDFGPPELGVARMGVVEVCVPVSGAGGGGGGRFPVARAATPPHVAARGAPLDTCVRRGCNQGAGLKADPSLAAAARASAMRGAVRRAGACCDCRMRGSRRARARGRRSRRGHPDTRRPREGEAGGARVGLSRWRRARPVGSASRPAAQSWSA